jgi:hypothetical protein
MGYDEFMILDSESLQHGTQSLTTTGQCCYKELSWVMLNVRNRVQNAFTSIKGSEHGTRRRRTAALYSKTSLLGSLHMYHVSHRVVYGRLIPRLCTAAAGNTDIDALALTYSLCSDYLSAWLFGAASGTNYLAKDNEAIDKWRVNYDNHNAPESFFPQEMPQLYVLFKKLGVDLMPSSYVESKSWLEGWMMEMAEKADKTIHQRNNIGQNISHEDQPIVYEATKAAVEKDSPSLSADEKTTQVLSEMFDHICESAAVLILKTRRSVD